MVYFQVLTLAVLVLLQVQPAFSRGPAVEDFVGIEVDHPEQTPQGTEGLFNFEKEITQYETKKNTSAQTATSPTSASSDSKMMITFTLILLLPMMIWGLFMYKLKHRAKVESVSNIETLEKYRTEREKLRKGEEELRKVS
jgi:hypothetical protein